jgi:transposase
MPFILRNRNDRATVQLAHASAMRSTNEVVEQLLGQVRQLQEQLKAEREQRAFDVQYYEGEIRKLLRDLIEAKYALAKHTLADAPSPSAALH